MKRTLVPWDYYSRRRGLSLAEILRSRGIETYEKLQYWMGTKGVECPSEADFNKAVESLKPAKKKRAAAPAKKAPAKPRAVRKRKAPAKKTADE